MEGIIFCAARRHVLSRGLTAVRYFFFAAAFFVAFLAGAFLAAFFTAFLAAPFLVALAFAVFFTALFFAVGTINDSPFC
jgi:hypothetical protein